MKAGQASKTAVLVCMGRALADADPALPSFSDPTAFALLPDEAKARVERARSGIPPKGWRQAAERGYLLRQSKIMAARTTHIDEAVRDAASPQVVILGAGLDGRAWRMPELAGVTVFEVDHPDSQREKRLRVEALTKTAGDVRFVPVDFTHDDLDQALQAAGHDSTKPTTWIWEGVVMYLRPKDIEATLDVVMRRSARGSRLVVLYFRPAFILRVVGPLVRALGEPLRSSFRPEKMRKLLGKYRFEAVRDESLPEIAKTMTVNVAEAAKFAKHLRIVTGIRF